MGRSAAYSFKMSFKMTTLTELADLEKEILAKIPMLKVMGIKIQRLNADSCIVQVPLAPNHNHKNTVFGGSLYAACTAACYALLYSLQKQACVENRDLVIAQGKMRYLKPVDQDFYVEAHIDLKQWQNVLKNIDRQKSGRLNMRAECKTALPGEERCVFEGEFAFVL